MDFNPDNIQGLGKETGIGLATHTGTPMNALGEGHLSLRPESFQEFVGQNQSIHNLQTFIQAAKTRQQPLDHVLLSGPPGLGKTTLANLIAKESWGLIKTTSGPVLNKAGDLVAILTHLSPYEVLFIDEIHRMPIGVEEILYSAMEDGRIDIMIGEGPQARCLQMTLPPFTLVGATTRWGLLSGPLRDRFGICISLDFYTPEQLENLLLLAAKRLNLTVTQEAVALLSMRARGTPRLALRLLRRVADFALVRNHAVIKGDIVAFALEKMDISAHGIDALDRRYLTLLGHSFQGGPTGLETLSAALFESKETLEDVIEPFLLQKGFLQRTPRGRKLTPQGWLALEDRGCSAAFDENALADKF